MKTILYNPIFINPQAYYVFPRLTRYLQPDNESTSEPANYIGTIEVKVIAYGDTTLKRTYTNTDSIDLSEFKNTWIRISLFTKVGSCVLGEWKIGNMESDLPYIDPEVLASLKAVVIVGNKTNNDSDRAIVKNLVDPDNPFVISNAAYTEGSGYADKDSPYYGAFVTDGIDDLIKSTKSATEMLDGSNEVTVVSMIHQIKTNDDTTRNNWFFTPVSYLENRVVKDKIGKTGIYGYTSTNVTNAQISDITPILGDKNDYTLYSKIEDGDRDYFTVEGFQNQRIWYVSSIAWYWTIIANKVLTTDQINQVIAYFNLDRTLKPDILCNTIKQGITNENHAEFGDKLIDYSGNGRDIQLNNLAWKGGSGIAAKPFETIKDYTIVSDEARQKLTIYNEFSYKVKSNTPNHYWTVQSIIKDNTSYQVTIITDKDCYWINATSFINSEGNKESIRKEYPVKANTPTQVIICGLDQFEYPEGIEPISAVSYVNLEYAGEITVTFIPSYKGGLLLDGVNDFGKVTGMPIYKDYTIVVDYERISGREEALISKAYIVNQGAFVLMETSGTAKHSYSFGAYTAFNRDDFTRTLLYQSKYKCGDVNLIVGKGIDGDTLWLGTLRDNDYRFFNGAIYSLMSFPYSMSEFLIERQLKKYKLGTLYPDMVEFRPIVKSNPNITHIKYYAVNGSKWTTINVGDYIPIGQLISVTVNVTPLSEIASVEATNLENVTVHKSTGQDAFDILGNVTSKSPQKINITIDEYIRYEDIVQPYPVLLRFKDENGNEVSWGGKFKVGSNITRIGSIADPESNLLNGLYSISGLSLNGKAVTSSTSIVEKQMVFRTTATWLLDNNEPKCILSPRLLRIPNSSYKILGHIPDISGHGNHGKINNSAYASMSGANGYLLDFKTFTTGNSSLVNIKDDSRIEVININKEKSTTFVNLNKSTSISLSSWKIKVTGMKSGDTLGYYYSESTDATLRSKFDIKSDGIYSLPSSIANSNNIGGIAFDVVAGADSAYRIEQIGEYESAYCLDGVDDFVTIPTLSSGGKQVLMKVNWNTINSIIYDQRGSGGFAIYCSDYNNPSDSITVPAYKGRNAAGTTYIDGIRNEYIIASQLRNVTHNIVEILDTSYAAGKTNPIIGKSHMNSNYGNLALYDFMLFDNISTDDKIKELNEYVGIEAKVELPSYYWDNYGKTNLDEDRDIIQQRGVAVGDYDLTNYNHAYEGMSGYNGYPVVFGANKTWTNKSNGYVTSITSNTIHITNVLNAGLALLYSYVKYNGNLQNIKEIPPFKIEIKGLEGRSKFIYKYLATSDATKETNLYLGNGTHELPKSFLPTEALVNDAVVGFSISPIEEGVTNFLSDITIEVLPEYENGLVYDGITDYSKNANIPALDDFTAIIKREWLKKQGCPLIKGSKVYEGGNGNALLLEWDKAYNFVFYKRTDIMEGELPDNISFITPTNYNGNVITRGSEQDTNGICIAGDGNAGFANMVFYKLILYPKTIPLLQINFLKNLMERDEIIDLNNPIFIQE